jgi:hypothetical protein
MKKPIIYLGEMTWEEAIDKASEMGMKVPTASLMCKILDIMKLEGMSPTMPSLMQTSTTYQWKTSNHVFAVNKPIQDLQQSDAVENGSKKALLKVYVVTPDMSEDDLYFGNYYFVDNNGEVMQASRMNF